MKFLTTPEFDRWLRKLKDRQGRLRILARLDRLAVGNFGDVKPLGPGLMELRFSFSPGYRIYLTRRGNQVVLLLCGGDKASQSDDILRARRIAVEWNQKENSDD